MRFTYITIALCAGLAAGACSKPEIDEKPAAKVEEAPAGSADKGDKAGEPAAKAEAAKTLKVDAATSKISFIGAKVTKSHHGGFKKFDGQVTIVGGKPGKASFTADIDSIYTDEEKLTGHLKSPDFFDMAKFPKATFESTTIKEGGEGGATHTVTGTLEMHGVKKQITFPATLAINDKEATAKAEFKINRKDWNIVYPGMPDDLIKDEVAIILDLHFPVK